MATYKLAVKGEIVGDQSPEEVRSNVAKLFKQDADSDQVKALFSGKAVVIKKGLDKAQAEKFVAALHSAGLKTYVINEQPQAVQEPPQEVPQADSQDTPQSSAEETPSQADPKDEPAIALEPVEQPAAVKPEVDASAAVSSNTEDASEQYNPYQQPQAELEVESEPGDFDLVDPKKLSFGDGWGWITEGYRLFRMQTGVWIGAFIIFFVINIVLSIIPFVNILANLLMPVFTAGFMVGAYKLFNGEDFELGDLFAGFKQRTGALIAVGALYFVGIIVVTIAFMGVLFGTMGMGAMNDIAAGGAAAAGSPMLVLALLVGFGLVMMVVMAYWFAPALVVLNEDIGAIQAMRMSFKACSRNLLPFTLYGFAALVLGIVAMIPLGLGLFVWVPVLTASIFAGYRQIFTDTEFY